jgi:hypothetical protein
VLLGVERRSGHQNGIVIVGNTSTGKGIGGGNEREGSENEKGS